MAQKTEELLQIKGIGKVLLKRLQEAKLDSVDKIAKSDEDDLKRISGLNPRNIPSILEQAKQLSLAAHQGDQAPAQLIEEKLAAVREQVQALACGTRDRFPEKLDGKCGKKISCDLVRIEESLSRLSFDGKKGAKRAGKALDKMGKKLSGLAEDAPLKKVRKALKRARKSALKAVR